MEKRERERERKEKDGRLNRRPHLDDMQNSDYSRNQLLLGQTDYE